jgi:hypothetical protein
VTKPETRIYASSISLGRCRCGHTMAAHENPGGLCGYLDCLCDRYRDENGSVEFELESVSTGWPAWFWFALGFASCGIIMAML